ncbi:peptide deformylase [Cephaloticoccus primus]|uniref:Peptide deformylase n=1 Tax=Cephaloticoccus primus TaxID=1548207 RepID=A0A139SU27_9BACT|nr:peptide deformylase [Cephaloticoccus primus]KXU38087.1 peptide deformylase [Cephaloticoccus primus]
MTLELAYYNSPVLREKGAPVTEFDTALRGLAAAMIQTMQESGGIGLAAQQVGRAIQLCVVDVRKSKIDFDWELDGGRPPLDLFMPMVLANPQITFAPKNEITIYEEGCLSFPKVGEKPIRADVERPDKITVHYQDEHGVPHVLKTDGLLSRCIQHEADHLKGTLFIDRLDRRSRTKVDPAIKALAKATEAEKNAATLAEAAKIPA